MTSFFNSSLILVEHRTGIAEIIFFFRLKKQLFKIVYTRLRAGALFDLTIQIRSNFLGFLPSPPAKKKRYLLVQGHELLFIVTGVSRSDYASEDLQSPGSDVTGRIPVEGQTGSSEG